MKDLTVKINESKENSVPWSESSAIIYTLWCITEAMRGARKNVNKFILSILNELSSEEVKRVMQLLERMSGEKVEYADHVANVLTNGIKFIPQTKGIKISRWDK